MFHNHQLLFLAVGQTWVQLAVDNWVDQGSLRALWRDWSSCGTKAQSSLRSGGCATALTQKYLSCWSTPTFLSISNKVSILHFQGWDVLQGEVIFFFSDCNGQIQTPLQIWHRESKLYAKHRQEEIALNLTLLGKSVRQHEGEKKRVLGTCNTGGNLQGEK